MVDFTAAPLQLTISGVSSNPLPLRAEPLALTATGQFGYGAPNWQGVDLPGFLRLDRVRNNIGIVDPKTGFPTSQYQAQTQRDKEEIERSISALVQSVNAIQSAFAAASEAQRIAGLATQSVEAVRNETRLMGSYTSPQNAVTASSAGVVTIATHRRVYTDGTTVSITGGTLSGFGIGQTVGVYYDDPSFSLTSPVFRADTGGGEAVQTNGRHVVGFVTIPGVGDPPTTGEGPTPPGRPPTFGDPIP